MGEEEWLRTKIEGVRAALLGDSILTHRQRHVLRLREGLEGKFCTLEEIGKEFNVSRERIRQIEHGATRLLYRKLRIGDEEMAKSISQLRKELGFKGYVRGAQPMVNMQAFQLPEKLATALLQKCEQENAPVNWIIAQALEAYFKS